MMIWVSLGRFGAKVGMVWRGTSFAWGILAICHSSFSRTSMRRALRSLESRRALSSAAVMVCMVEQVV